MSSRQTLATRHRGIRGATFVVAWICLLAQAMGLMHLALVRHTTCAEHGEVTEAAEPPVEAVEAAPAPDTSPD